MSRARKPLEISVYYDVLCSWCYVAERRLTALGAELAGIAHFKFRPYALRPQEALPTRRELDEIVRELHRARKEPEGAALNPELWTGQDLPRSSVPALAAVEAARLQGPEARQALLRAMQRAALEQGVNVTRSDVVFELASRVGLQMNRFSAAFGAPETRRLILEEHRMATERGIKGVPTLVIAGRWMVSGLKDFSEYREHVLACLAKLERERIEPDRMLH